MLKYYLGNLAKLSVVLMGALLIWGCPAEPKKGPPPPVVSTGAVTWDHQTTVALETFARDTAISPDGKFVFILADGAVLVYDTEKESLVDTIAVNAAFDAIDVSAGDILTLTGNGSQEMRLIQIERVYDIDIADRPYRGAAEAPVVIAVFDDYQCPYCSKLETTFKQLLKKYPREIKVVIKHFPLSSHRYAVPAAKAALAAHRQGKFWAFHERLFENYNSMDLGTIDRIAKSLNLDMIRFRADAASPEIQQIIVSDMENGRRIGVRGTPTIYINGKPLNDRSISGFSRMIEAEVKRKGTDSE